MFAVSDVVWQSMIAAAVAIYMEWSRQETAKAVREVKTTLVSSTSASAKQIADVRDKVDTVVQQTNGMIQQLQDIAEQKGRDAGLTAGHAAGVADEKAREK